MKKKYNVQKLEENLKNWKNNGNTNANIIYKKGD